MKAPSFLCLLVFSALAPCQPSQPADFANTTLTADKLSRDGPLLRGSGHVRVNIAGVLLEADEGTRNLEQRAIDLHGHALVTLPDGPPFWIIRCGPGLAIVVTEPMTVAADELRVAAGMLRARGHIQTKKDLTVFEANEADFNLNAGEAEIRGNILVNGSSPEPPASRARRHEMIFPPDIVR